MTNEILDVDGWLDRGRAIWQRVQVPNAQLDGDMTKILCLLPGREVHSKRAQVIETTLHQRATGIQPQDQVLLRDADLIRNALLRVGSHLPQRSTMHCCVLEDVCLKRTSGQALGAIAGPSSKPRWHKWQPSLHSGA